AGAPARRESLRDRNAETAQRLSPTPAGSAHELNRTLGSTDKAPCYPAAYRLHDSVGRHHTVTTTFPTCWFDSRQRWASTIWSRGNFLAMSGLKLPSASPSLMNFFARSRRCGSLVISIIT